MTEIFIGRNERARVSLQAKYAHRHGVITSALGIGKLVSLKALADDCGGPGVTSFLANAGGARASFSMTAGDPGARLATVKQDGWSALANPVIFRDSPGARGHAADATVSESSKR